MARKKRVEKRGEWKKYVFWAVVVIILLVVIYSGGIILGMVACPPNLSPAVCCQIFKECGVLPSPPVVPTCVYGSKETVEVGGTTSCGEGECSGVFVRYCNENGAWEEPKCNTAGEFIDEWECKYCSDSDNPTPLNNAIGHMPDSGDYTTSCYDGCTGDGEPKWKSEGSGSSCPTPEDEGKCVSIMTGAGEALGMTVPLCSCTDYSDFSLSILLCSGSNVLKCMPPDEAHSSAYYAVKEKCDAEDGIHNLCVSTGQVNIDGSKTRGTYYSGDCVGMGSGYLEQQISHCDIVKCGVGYDAEGNEILPINQWKCVNTEFNAPAVVNHATCIDPNNP